jgi:hypothetical protein
MGVRGGVIRPEIPMLRRVRTILIAWGLAALGTSVSAEIVTVHASGLVRAPLLIPHPPGIAAGDLFEALYRYDASAPDQAVDPTMGFYDAVQSIEIRVGGMPLEFPYAPGAHWGALGSLLVISNDRPSTRNTGSGGSSTVEPRLVDEYGLDLNVEGTAGDLFYFRLSLIEDVPAASGASSALLSDALTDVPPPVAAFSGRSLTWGFSEQGVGPTQFFVQASLDTLTVVPLPPAFAVLGAPLLCVFGRGTRGRRRFRY